MTKNEKEMEVVKNEELVKRTEVENTPFVLVEQDGNKFLTLGNYRITDVDLTDEELKELTMRS